MAIDEQRDLIPTNFIIKVFQTRVLAEENNDFNALKIFNNGIYALVGEFPDPVVANGSQFIMGAAEATITANILNDSNAKFGPRLVGNTITNINDSTSAVITAVGGTATEAPETQLALDEDIFDTIGHLYYIERPGHFFIFQKYFYRIEATDPVLGFIIDWDDGEDNSPEKANRQTIKLDTPQYYAIVEHTYTHHGKHYPMIRTISPEGFYSKWYVSYGAVVANDLKSIETQLLVGGQNEYSIVSADLPHATGLICRMPEFAPANMPPIGVLKVDRTSVFSGIDNAVIPVDSNGLPDGSWKAYAYVDRTGGTTLSSMTGGIEVIYKTTKDRIIKETITPHSDASAIATRAFPADGAAAAGGDGFLKEVLSVKLVEMREGTSVSPDRLGPDERIYIQIYEDNDVATPTLAPLSDNPITFVSLGNPIQTLDRPGFSVLAEGSQSQTRASNVSLSKYWFEEGKLAGTLRAEPNGALQISDAFGFTVDSFAQTVSHLHTYYSFNHHNILLDATTRRFPDEERLYRLQVEDTSASTRIDTSSFYVYGGGIDTNKNITEPITTESEVTLTIESDNALLVGDVIKITPVVGDDEEMMRVLKINTATEIVVERGFQGTATDTYADNGSIFLISDNGRQGDSLTRSFIEHFDPTSYYYGNRPVSLLSRALLLYGNIPTGSDVGGGQDVQWTNRMAQNNINSGTYNTDSNGIRDRTGDGFLVFGGVKHGTKTEGSTEQNYTELTGGWSHNTAGGNDENPQNYILCAKTDKFNKLHIRMNNDYSAIALQLRDSDWYETFDGDELYINITAWYTAKASSIVSQYIWKPLSIVDGTATGEYNSSLRRSGTIYFDMPDDWVSIKSSNINGGTWLGPVSEDSTVTEHINNFPTTINAPEDIWTEDMYGLLLGLAVNETSGNSSKLSYFRGYSVIPYNNSHSQVIKIVDPHHKSLNDVAITSDISLSRAGKYIEITDRIGRTEIRRIGAAGGELTFGGVELSGEFTTTKAALLKYQREGTPVYLDVERVNGDFVRVYGVISSMSETFPVGKALPKFGITMKVEYIAEYDSSGDWISSGLMALGGEIIDEPKYLL